ncbi:MAG: hypothetical protein M1827_006435 [Pycnora praestabilis]|nr:MAG: hypothetical protein M1827_006435 [Pycnora praestabilis]
MAKSFVRATANAKQSLEYGTYIVGGVTPGKDGEHLGLPVLPTVRAATETLKPDATAVFVAAQHAGKAIEEAIEAEVPLIVAVAEHIPIHDVLRTQSRSRLVGPNCPGIISPIGNCRIGFQPLPTFSAGAIGIVAKSGTLSYETVASTTRAGLGQSLVIGMGGDVLAGTNFVDALQLFEHDDATEGIIIVGEIGGTAEEEAAQWIKAYTRRTNIPKPIMALVGGTQAAPGRVMGHAGAFVAADEADALAKIRAFEDAGVVMVNHPAKFGNGMKSLLERAAPRQKSTSTTGSIQRRSLHTIHIRRPSVKSGISNEAQHLRMIGLNTQQRALHLKQSQAFDMLRDRGIAVTEPSSSSGKEYNLSVAIDRSNRSPCIVVSPALIAGQETHHPRKKFPFDYQAGFDGSLVHSIAEELRLDHSLPASQDSLVELLWGLVSIFMEREASMLETSISVGNRDVQVHGARFVFDDAAYKSAKRQEDVHKLRRVQDEISEEVEAEKDGIVYIKLAGEGNIGTLVNGAGLAMNTNDALAAHGGKNANFLDTGGKATSETVKSSFRIILKDSRVKAIFVNIFGGLTLCDMIAEGIILAFKDLRMKVPVVVRLRGTNEEIGQKMIARSGLPLHAFDDFEEAADKVIALANGAAD